MKWLQMVKKKIRKCRMYKFQENIFEEKNGKNQRKTKKVTKHNDQKLIKILRKKFVKNRQKMLK